MSIFCSTLFTVGPSFSACTLVAGQRDGRVVSHQQYLGPNANSLLSHVHMPAPAQNLHVKQDCTKRRVQAEEG